MINNLVEENTETILSYRTGLEFDKPEADLLLAIDKAMNESKALKQKVDGIGEMNFSYWQKGTLAETNKFHPRKSKVIVNRIFTDMETSIPIITSEPPETSVLGSDNNDIKAKIQKGLEIAYDVKYKMQQIFQKMVRSWYLSRIGVLKYRWDKENGFITENVDNNKIGFDARATGLYSDCEYVWETLEDTIDNLILKFPNKKKEIEAAAGGEKTPKSKIRYIEFWGGRGEWVCWRLNNVILDKKKNPNFDWEDQYNNLFKKAKFPYIVLNVFTAGQGWGLYDSTSLVEEAAPIQEAVNELEQQIFDLNEGRKRVWVAAGEAISEEKAQQLVNETGDLLVYLDRKGSKDALGQVQSGTPDTGMYNNLTHLMGEIDNVMGMHSTTRGERAQQETATGRQLLVGSDYGRLDLVVRNLEQCSEDWFNAYLHMVKVYAIEAETLESEEESIELTAQDIPNTIKIMVVKGSTLPIDERTKRDNALVLAGMGMIDPESLFEELGYPNTEERTQKLFQWLIATGKLVPQMAQPSVGGQTGQQGAITGQPEAIPDEVKDQQLQRIQGLVRSPEFNQLSPEDRKRYLQEARQAVAAVQGQ